MTLTFMKSCWLKRGGKHKHATFIESSKLYCILGNEYLGTGQRTASAFALDYNNGLDLFTQPFTP